MTQFVCIIIHTRFMISINFTFHILCNYAYSALISITHELKRKTWKMFKCLCILLERHLVYCCCSIVTSEMQLQLVKKRKKAFEKLMFSNLLQQINAIWILEAICIFLSFVIALVSQHCWISKQHLFELSYTLLFNVFFACTISTGRREKLYLYQPVLPLW